MPFHRVIVRPALRFWAVAVALFAGTIALYSRVLGYGFTNYDDPRYITSNPHVQSGFTFDSIRWAFVGNADYWHPLTWLSHIADWQIYGENAAGHHLTSVLWHATNAVLALVVLRRLTGTFWTSAFAAALFAWHPLRVESVAWVTERKDVMSGCFFLLTIWTYAVYADRRREHRAAARWYAMTLVLFAAGLMCKPTLVTLPLLLLALDFWPLGRLAPARVDANAERPIELRERCQEEYTRPATSHWPVLLIEKAPFFTLSALTALLTVRMQQEVGAFTLHLPLAARLANAPVAIARYTAKFFWPTGLTVCYRHPGWWPTPIVVGALALVSAISVVAWRSRRRQPWIMVGWCWLLATLLPTLGFVQVGFQAMADRYTYVSILGGEIALVWTLRSLWLRYAARRLAVAAGAGALLAAGMLTWQQQATWRDSETLFRHAIAVTHDNDMAEAFLGYTLLAAQRYDDATLHCRRALALDPQNEMAVYTLTQVDLQQGRLDAAISGYRRSLELKPNDASTRYELGLLLLKTGKMDEAAEQLRDAAKRQPNLVAANVQLAAHYANAGRAVDAAAAFAAAALLEPSNARAQLAAGQAFARVGRKRDALASLQRAVALDPALSPARLELAFLLLNQGDPAAAAEHLRTALKSEPELANAWAALGRAEEQLGHTTNATTAFEHALKAAPNDAAVQRAWAETLARRGDFDSAVSFYRRAVQLQPADAAAHAGLGFVLFLTQRRTEAIAEWKEALRLDPHFPGLRERLEKLTR